MGSVFKGENFIICITEPHIFSIIVIQLNHLLIDLIYTSLSCRSSSFTGTLFLWVYNKTSMSLIFLLILETNVFFFLSRMDGQYCFHFSVKVLFHFSVSVSILILKMITSQFIVLPSHRIWMMSADMISTLKIISQT